jgi:hypothetical protein
MKNIRCGGGRIGGRGRRRDAQFDRGGLESDEQEQDFPCFRKRKVVDKDRIDQDQSENVQQVSQCSPYGFQPISSFIYPPF